MLSSESLLGIPIQAFADTVIGFLVFGTALMMTGAGKFFINLVLRAVRNVSRRRGQGVHLRQRPARHGRRQHRVERADRRHHDHPGDEEDGLSRVLRRRHRSMRVDRRRAGAAGHGRHGLRHGAVHERQLRRGRLAATIPSVLYYVGLFMQVDSYAARHKLKGIPRAELPRLSDAIKEGWYYLFVIVLLVVMLLHFKRESHAPFYASALLVILHQWSGPARWRFGNTAALIASVAATGAMLWYDIPHAVLWGMTVLIVLNEAFPGKNWGRGRWVEFLEINGKTFVELIAILAGCGLLIGAFSMTGVISSLANDLLRIAGNDAFLLLVMCAVTSLILGPRPHHHRLLHLPRHPGRAGAGEARPQQDGRAHVHLLLGHAVVDHAAGGDRLVRGGRHCRLATHEDRVGEHVGRQHHLFHPVLLRAEPGARCCRATAPTSRRSGSPS